MRKPHLILLIFLLFTLSFAELEVPKLTRRVTDLAGILTPEQISSLEYKLSKFEEETTNQIAVLIIPSLEGESIEDFSIRVVEKNKLGQAGKDNGVLFLIAVQDRKMRLEVGYGLEGVLPDALCDQILRNVVRPKFRQGNYYAGIDAGIDAIISATKGEFKADPRKKPETNIGTILALIIIGIVLLTFFGSIMRGIRHYTIGSGGADSTLFWLWLLSSMSEHRGKGSGGSWGGWTSGGGFWGGGWSGGGGRFGGGGASSSW